MIDRDNARLELARFPDRRIAGRRIEVSGARFGQSMHLWFTTLQASHVWFLDLDTAHLADVVKSTCDLGAVPWNDQRISPSSKRVARVAMRAADAHRANLLELTAS